LLQRDYSALWYDNNNCPFQGIRLIAAIAGDINTHNEGNSKATLTGKQGARQQVISGCS